MNYVKNLSQQTLGYLFAFLAFIQWGFFPVYFKFLSHVSSSEILAHRILWSVVLLVIILALTHQLKALKRLFYTRQSIKLLFISSLLISLNWLIYIWAINHNQLAEAMLGYYINPLVSAGIGIALYKEKPTKWQIVALLLAFVAIAYQMITLKTIPFVSLSLGFSFAFYGYVRKKAHVSSALGLTVETLMMFPFALGYFIYLQMHHLSAFVIPLDTTSILLVFLGVITVLPLLCFNAAATRISLMYLGFIQYISPTIGLLLAVFVYHEPLSYEKLITFIFIWTALFIISSDAYFRHQKNKSLKQK